MSKGYYVRGSFFVLIRTDPSCIIEWFLALETHKGLSPRISPPPKKQKREWIEKFHSLLLGFIELRNLLFHLAWLELSGQISLPYGPLRKFWLTAVFSRGWKIKPNFQDEMLNFFNSSFFQLLSITHLFTSRYYSLTKSHNTPYHTTWVL